MKRFYNSSKPVMEKNNIFYTYFMGGCKMGVVELVFFYVAKATGLRYYLGGFLLNIVAL